MRVLCEMKSTCCFVSGICHFEHSKLQVLSVISIEFQAIKPKRERKKGQVGHILQEEREIYLFDSHSGSVEFRLKNSTVIKQQTNKLNFVVKPVLVFTRARCV